MIGNWLRNALMEYPSGRNQISGLVSRVKALLRPRYRFGQTNQVYRPSLEALEDRVMLAGGVFHFTGKGENDLWTTPDNWRKFEQGQDPWPQQDARVVIGDPGPGPDKLRTVTLDRNISIRSLSMGRNAEDKTKLVLRNNLDVTWSFTMYGGVIDGPGTLTITVSAREDIPVRLQAGEWWNGTMTGTGKTVIQSAPEHRPFQINPRIFSVGGKPGRPVLNRRTLEINKDVYVEWNVGDFVVVNGASIENNGQFIARSSGILGNPDAQVGDAKEPSGVFNNLSLFQKRNEVTTIIQARFNHSKWLYIEEGSLNLVGGGTIKGAGL